MHLPSSSVRGSVACVACLNVAATDHGDRGGLAVACVLWHSRQSVIDGASVPPWHLPPFAQPRCSIGAPAPMNRSPWQVTHASFVIPAIWAWILWLIGWKYSGFSTTRARATAAAHGACASWQTPQIFGVLLANSV